ncbi:MAG: glucose-1-phosphate adenylyltransferase [Bacillota bacterium]|nr:glucose-1-phosphate adenylyltransferase [Bacillota bacterium]
MYRKTECIAMLLAGGRGSRLGVLTRNRAKPTIPFGDEYKVIDFALSNCSNSGMDTVGVLTQYQPLELNEYIGDGQPWNLNGHEGGVRMLPSCRRQHGTANAIYQNISFIEQYNPEHVLVISADHIYKMNYSKMLDYHKKNHADCTISVIDVPDDQTSRFGIMNTDSNGKIYEFEEKPQRAKSNKASMGVYIFTWKKLKHYLELDERDKSSSNDFGMNIIPMMLDCGEQLYAYFYKGYWRDVGTIESLWEANMDLIRPENNLFMKNPEWMIYTRRQTLLPSYFGPKSVLSNSLIAEGCVIYGEVYSSVISRSAYVAPGAVVRDSIVMPNARILRGAKVNKAVIDEYAEIGVEEVVGHRAQMNDKSVCGINVIGSGLYESKHDIAMKKGYSTRVSGVKVI